MKIKITLIHLLLFVICSVHAQKNLFEYAIAESDKLAQQTFEKGHFPGMAIYVSVKGKTIWCKGYGYANLSEKEGVDPYSSKFRVGSISKSFTSAGLGRLYDAEKINLNVPIQTYVPYFPKKKYDVTLKFLAGHIGGIRHYKGTEFLSNKHYHSVKEGLEIFMNDPLIFEPGTKYAYSSYGWNLISAAMEQVSKKDFLTYMAKSVFKPLKMKNTMPDYSDRKIPKLAEFYELNDNREIVLAPVVDNSYKWAGGGFLSTAEDVGKFANAFLNPGFLSESTLEKWTTSQRTTDGKIINYGIGWRTGNDERGLEWFGHSGGSVGGTSMMLVYPDKALVVVILINLSNAEMDDLAFKIANAFMGL